MRSNPTDWDDLVPQRVSLGACVLMALTCRTSSWDPPPPAGSFCSPRHDIRCPLPPTVWRHPAAPNGRAPAPAHALAHAQLSLGISPGLVTICPSWRHRRQFRLAAGYAHSAWTAVLACAALLAACQNSVLQERSSSTLQCDTQIQHSAGCLANSNFAEA